MEVHAEYFLKCKEAAKWLNTPQPVSGIPKEFLDGAHAVTTSFVGPCARTSPCCPSRCPAAPAAPPTTPDNCAKARNHPRANDHPRAPPPPPADAPPPPAPSSPPSSPPRRACDNHSHRDPTRNHHHQPAPARRSQPAPPAQPTAAPPPAQTPPPAPPPLTASSAAAPPTPPLAAHPRSSRNHPAAPRPHGGAPSAATTVAASPRPRCPHSCANDAPVPCACPMPDTPLRPQAKPSTLPPPASSSCAPCKPAAGSGPGLGVCCAQAAAAAAGENDDDGGGGGGGGGGGCGSPGMGPANGYLQADEFGHAAGAAAPTAARLDHLGGAAGYGAPATRPEEQDPAIVALNRSFPSLAALASCRTVPRDKSLLFVPVELHEHFVFGVAVGCPFPPPADVAAADWVPLVNRFVLDAGRKCCLMFSYFAEGTVVVSLESFNDVGDRLSEVNFFERTAVVGVFPRGLRARMQILEKRDCPRCTAACRSCNCPPELRAAGIARDRLSRARGPGHGPAHAGSSYEDENVTIQTYPYWAQVLDEYKWSRVGSYCVQVEYFEVMAPFARRAAAAAAAAAAAGAGAGAGAGANSNGSSNNKSNSGSGGSPQAATAAAAAAAAAAQRPRQLAYRTVVTSEPRGTVDKMLRVSLYEKGVSALKPPATDVRWETASTVSVNAGNRVRNETRPAASNMCVTDWHKLPGLQQDYLLVAPSNIVTGAHARAQLAQAQAERSAARARTRAPVLPSWASGRAGVFEHILSSLEDFDEPGDAEFQSSRDNFESQMMRHSLAARSVGTVMRPRGTPTKPRPARRRSETSPRSSLEEGRPRIATVKESNRRRRGMRQQRQHQQQQQEAQQEERHMPPRTAL